MHYAIIPGFIGPRTQGDLLLMTGCAIVRVGDDRHGPVYENVTLDGWDGDVEVEEIIVKWTEQCLCERPCCKGEYTAMRCVGWESVMALYAEPMDDEPLWSDEHAWWNERTSEYIGY